MCLHRIATDQEKQDLLTSIKNDTINVYKVVLANKKKKKYRSIWQKSYYESGINEADTSYDIYIIYMGNTSQYQSGFHFFLTEKDALLYKNTYKKGLFDSYYLKFKIIKCTINKEWITEIGQDHTDYDNRITATTLVTSKAIFPKYKKYFLF